MLSAEQIKYLAENLGGGGYGARARGARIIAARINREWENRGPTEGTVQNWISGFRRPSAGADALLRRMMEEIESEK